jgi:hypothetical protein
VALNRHSQACHVGFMGLAVAFWVAKPSGNKESTPQVAHQKPLRSGSTNSIRTSLQAIDFIDYFKNTVQIQGNFFIPEFAKSQKSQSSSQSYPQIWQAFRRRSKAF